jgi:hypothetical protein
VDPVRADRRRLAGSRSPAGPDRGAGRRRRAGGRARLAPPWLRERIDLCYGARLAVGERVTEDENARDQLAAPPCTLPGTGRTLDGP